MRAALVDEKRAKASSAHAAAVQRLVEHERHRLLDHLAAEQGVEDVVVARRPSPRACRPQWSETRQSAVPSSTESHSRSTSAARGAARARTRRRGRGARGRRGRAAGGAGRSPSSPAGRARFSAAHEVGADGARDVHDLDAARRRAPRGRARGARPPPRRTPGATRGARAGRGGPRRACARCRPAAASRSRRARARARRSPRPRACPPGTRRRSTCGYEGSESGMKALKPIAPSACWPSMSRQRRRRQRAPQAEVDDDLALGHLALLAVQLDRRDRRVGQRVLDHGRDAAGRRRLVPGGEVLALGVSGILEVRVHVDRAGHHDEPGGVDQLVGAARGAGLGERGDAVALDHDVGGEHAVVRRDRAARDHRALLPCRHSPTLANSYMRRKTSVARRLAGHTDAVDRAGVVGQEAKSAVATIAPVVFWKVPVASPRPTRLSSPVRMMARCGGLFIHCLTMPAGLP